MTDVTDEEVEAFMRASAQSPFATSRHSVVLGLAAVKALRDKPAAVVSEEALETFRRHRHPADGLAAAFPHLLRDNPPPPTLPAPPTADEISHSVETAFHRGQTPRLASANAIAAWLAEQAAR